MSKLLLYSGFQAHFQTIRFISTKNHLSGNFFRYYAEYIAFSFFPDTRKNIFLPSSVSVKSVKARISNGAVRFADFCIPHKCYCSILPFWPKTQLALLIALNFL